MSPSTPYRFGRKTYVTFDAKPFLANRRGPTEREMYERAGWCTRILDRDGLVLQRSDYSNDFIVEVDIPTPEFLLT